MTFKPNWHFIAQLEGATNYGYVPDPKVSRSGVTIASGVDLGGENEAALADLPSDLLDKLVPYFGYTGQNAVAKLQGLPLYLTDNEVATLNAVVDGHEAEAFERLYNAETGLHLEDLAEAAQTIGMSVAFQYGDIKRRCPTFWHHFAQQDWQGCYNELKHFGDLYTSRHNREAAYLVAGGLAVVE
jgi:hypothetical protein